MIEIPNGFLGIIRDDGQEVACGFNEVLSVALPSGQVTRIDTGGEASAAGFHAGRIAFSRYLTQTTRELVNGPIQVNPNQAPGKFPTLAVANGHVVSSANGQHFIDGGIVAYDTGNSSIESNDGKHYLYKPQNVAVPWPVLVRDVFTMELKIWIANDISNAAIWTDANGRPWVFCNRGDHAEIYNSDGLIYAFPAGEFRGALSEGPTEPWAWTCGQIGADPFIYGRPFSALGEPPAVTLQGQWWAGLAVVWKPNEGKWVVAGYYNGPGGTLYINPDVTPANVPVQPQPPIVAPPNVRVISVRPGETVMIQGLP